MHVQDHYKIRVKMEMGCRHDCQLHKNTKTSYGSLLYCIVLCILGLQWYLLAISIIIIMFAFALMVGDLDELCLLLYGIA